jgi:hypothetical protein
MMREDDTKKLLASQAAGITLVHNHNLEERKDGKIKPYSKQELALFDSLLHQQDQISKKQEIPLGDPFDGAARTVASVASSAGDGISSIGKSVTENLLLPAAAIGVLGLLAYAVIKTPDPPAVQVARPRPQDDPEIETIEIAPDSATAAI